MTDELNPFVMVKRAASGDLETQRALAREAEVCLRECDIAGFWEGLTYARMAAAQGDASDKGLVISLIALAAHLLDPDDDAGRAGYAGQTMAYALAASEQMKGEDGAGFHALFEQAMDTADAETMRSASYYTDLMRQAEKMGEE